MLSQIRTETNCPLVKSDPYAAWCICNAVTHHFRTKSYDAVKYRYKMPWFNRNKFAADKNQWLYKKIARDYPTQDSVIKLAYVNANVGNYFIREYDEGLYEELQSWLQSQAYNFERELKKATQEGQTFDEILTADTYKIPPVFKYTSMNTIVALDLMTDFVSRAERVCQETLQWPQKLAHYKNNKTFLSQWINKEKLKKIAIKVFTT